MSLARRLVDLAESAVVRILCRVDADELKGVPHQGPLILVMNHVSFLEIPVLHSRLRSRNVVALAKAEAWENRVFGRLLDLWGAVPVRRGEQDLAALRRCLEVLSAGGILALAPEGTRSHHGRLQRARSGVVTIALKSGAPILPIGFYGGETFKDNLKRLRRTPFHVRLGTPFRLVAPEGRVRQDVRQSMADEIMHQIALLLPPEYRGAYREPLPEGGTFLQPIS